MLDFSRIDAGRLSINTQDLDLIDIIDEAITLLRPQADAKALLLRCELAPGLPRHVQGDPNRIRQILLNLLGNAIKFTERGEVRLRASGETTDGLARVSFSISDTGPGIPLEVLPRLFRKFEPADLSSTRRADGPGDAGGDQPAVDGAGRGRRAAGRRGRARLRDADRRRRGDQRRASLRR